jgi:hypothetical protein
MATMRSMATPLHNAGLLLLVVSPMNGSELLERPARAGWSEPKQLR